MSLGSPMVRGEISEGGVIELLRQCETKRLTGLLRFEGKGTDVGIAGVVRLFGGEIAVDQDRRDDGLDPVDVLLDLESASWEVDLSLPPLPVSRGNDLARSGSLAVHVPVDLMTYCEHAGLTGTLELEHGERKAEAVYEAGELLAIELDGRDATDLHEVFAWEAGHFRVAIDPEAPKRFHEEPEPLEDEADDFGWSPAPPKKREDTRQFLRVVEVALVDVLERSEKARSPTRTSPPLPPPPKARPRPKTVPPPPQRSRRDQTVRLIYLSGERSPVTRDEDTGSTRHVASGNKAEAVGEKPEPRRRSDEKEEPMAKKRRKNKRPARPSSSAKPEAKKAAGDEPAEPATKKPAAEEPNAPRGVRKRTDPVEALKKMAGASAWALGVLLLGLVILYVLGKLPPVQ